MKLKKKAALLAALSLVMALSVSAKAPYTDLQSIQNRSAIDYLYDTHCLPFVTGTTFAPQQALTRGELAQLVYATAMNLPLADETFSDAPTPKANDAMAAVATQGILTGYEDGSFQPDRTVTREEFASVLYRYLKYNGLDDVSNSVTPYMDEASISPENREAVRYLQMKGLMTSGGTYFHPKEAMTRLAAVETMYHVVRSDSTYISHVDVERQVIRALNAEYGGMPAFFQQGTLYWDGDALVIGTKGKPRMFLNQRLQHNVSRYDAIQFRRVRFARADYDQMMNRAVSIIVNEEGVQNYVGAIPDFSRERIDIIVRRPIAETTQNKLDSAIGKGIIVVHDIASYRVKPEAPITDEEVTDKTKNRSTVDVGHSPLYDQSTNAAVDWLIRDTMK